MTAKLYRKWILVDSIAFLLLNLLAFAIFVFGPLTATPVNKSFPFRRAGSENTTFGYYSAYKKQFA